MFLSPEIFLATLYVGPPVFCFQPGDKDRDLLFLFFPFPPPLPFDHFSLLPFAGVLFSFPLVCSYYAFFFAVILPLQPPQQPSAARCVQFS